MNLFINYVQPLTNWLQHNPNWSLFITFLISLTESLAIIGSIIPGSITMTAIGILAGSGFMHVKLTLLAAILGAVAGDGLSYALGYYYSEQLTEIWPFSKYPKWLQYGKDFFNTHGGKSILIGRFVGPFRSIIPVIAGILHMNQWHFFIANFLSAIGWSFLYIMPGFLLGAASHELSPETTASLFIFILILLAGIWLMSLAMKWLIKRLNSFLKTHLHTLWIKLKYHIILAPIYQLFTPKEEKNHYITASLVFITFFSMFGLITLLVLTIKTQWLSLIDLPTYLFLRSFDTTTLKAFFIFCTQLTSTFTLTGIFCMSSIWIMYNDKVSTVIYLLSLLIFTALSVFILKHSMYISRPSGVLVRLPGSSFPALNLEIATALYGFILFYIQNTYAVVRLLVFIILGLSGLGSIYLGDHWLTDILGSYVSGTTICLIHCLIYRKTNFNYIKISCSLWVIFSLFISTLIFSLLSTFYHFQILSSNHTSYHPQYNLSEKMWWEQKKPTLPLYQLSRVGKRTSLLNLQYAGDLHLLQHDLEKNGWIAHADSFFSNLVTRMKKQAHGVKLPLLTQLYENKSPTLVMTYLGKKSNIMLELRIWKSNYILIKSNTPLWIGSIHSTMPAHKQKNTGHFEKPINPLHYMFKNDRDFIVKQIIIPKALVKATKYPTQSSITLIRVSN